MAYMFCETAFKSSNFILNLGSRFDTSNVIDMSFMFNGCHALDSIDVSNWDASKVINMWAMFYGCVALTSLDVSGWNTSKVTNMESMFYSCKNLKEIT